MRVGILGSGLIGGNLGTIFARAGHEVVFICARSNGTLKRRHATTKVLHAPVRQARLRNI